MKRTEGTGEDNTAKRSEAVGPRSGPPLTGVLGVCVAYRYRMPAWKTEAAREMRKNPTEGERLIWQRLRRNQLGVAFRRQAPMLGYIVDFWCPSRSLVVEIDGSSHDGRVKYDETRDMALGRKGIRVVRISGLYAVHNTDDAVAMIRAAL